MPTINNVEHLRKWFRGCPALLKSNHFRVDYLAEEATEYALYSVPSTMSFHENVLGEMVPDDVQNLNFIFASKEAFGAAEMQNIANYGFYQDVIAWIIEQNAAGNLPPINEGRVLSIVPTLTAYVSAPGVNSAKYQIQIKVRYRLT